MVKNYWNFVKINEKFSVKKRRTHTGRWLLIFFFQIFENYRFKNELHRSTFNGFSCFFETLKQKRQLYFILLSLFIFLPERQTKKNYFSFNCDAIAILSSYFSRLLNQSWIYYEILWFKKPTNKCSYEWNLYKRKKNTNIKLFHGISFCFSFFILFIFFLILFSRKLRWDWIF